MSRSHDPNVTPVGGQRTECTKFKAAVSLDTHLKNPTKEKPMEDRAQKVTRTGVIIIIAFF